MVIDNKALLRLSATGPLKLLRFSSRIHVLPSLCIYLTSACNFDCIMCESRRSNKEIERQHMPFDLFAKLAGECSRLRFKPRIHFSGLGEPLVYSKFDKVISLCQHHKLPWSLTTNGLALGQYAEKLIRYGCRGINLSVHGVGEGHDGIVGTNGAFNRVKEALESMVKITVPEGRRKVRRPPIAVNCVVNNHNVLDLNQIYEELSSWPINSITFQYISFSKEDCSNGADFIIKDETKLAELSLFVREMKRRKPKIPVNFFPHLSDGSIKPYHTDSDFPVRVQCFLPWLSLRIYPDGTTKMCEKEFGNIQEATVVEIMNGKAAQQFRSLVRNQKFIGDVCFRCCHRFYS